MQATALEAARNYEKDALERIRRMSLAAADLEVKGQRKMVSHASISGPNDEFFQETNLV
jgi:COP9 signalosome complex subunit 1